MRKYFSKAFFWFASLCLLLQALASSSLPLSQAHAQTTSSDGKVTAIVLENVSAPSLDLSSSTYSTSATITSDKSDYSPIETAVLTGSSFDPNKTYTLEIISSDAPAVDFATSITTNDKGEFVYAYQLDGNYRPNYTVYIKDGSTTVATTKFTDANIATDISQCQNGGIGDPLQPCNESDFPAASGYGYEGNANSNGGNSHWFEGDFVPLRIVGTNYSVGAGNIQFSIDVTKGGKHAYDYIGTFSSTETTGAPTSSHANHNNPVGDIISGDLPTTPDSSGAIPAAALSGFPAACGSNTFAGSQAAGTIKAWGTSGPLTVTYVSQNVGSSDCTTTIQVAWGATQPTFGGTIVIAYAPHIAKQSDWGAGNSAININGSPYHSSLVQRTTGNDTKGIGNQDAKLAASAVVLPSTLTVNKTCVPSNDPGKFNLRIDGNTAGTGADALCGGTTGQVTVTAGSHTVSETAGTGTSLSNYASLIGGDCAANGTVSVAAGENKVCTITNTLQTGTLLVKKHVVNDNGGSASASAFTLHVKSGVNDVANSPAAGSESGTSYTLNAGAYVVSENTPPSGYTQTGFSGDCDSNGSVTVVTGQTKTCTITNNDVAPQLHLRKTITNDNGGTAANTDWTLTATGTGGSPTNLSGSTPVDSTGTFKADTYALGESGPSGYTAGAWNCGAATMPNATHVTVPFGGDVTCTINNNDIAPKLTVIKIVQNNHGGTLGSADFTMNVAGTNVSDPSFPGSESGTQVTLDKGTYQVTENEVSGYTTVGTSADCSGTINVGEEKTCTITNGDTKPMITVIKHVINDNGGTAVAGDFTMNVTATNPDPASHPGTEDGRQVSVDAGSYSVDEGSHVGYTKTLGSNCSGSIAVGQTKTCTITNDDIQPKLTLIKHVVNNDGGTLGVADFPLFVDATGVTSGASNGFNAGDYTASETNKDGYAPSDWSGDCSEDGSITLHVGDDKTCEITNDDISPKLKVIKHVINNNGGLAVAGDFTMSVTGTSVENPSFPGDELGTTTKLHVGSYSADEGTHAGYDKSLSDDCSGSIALGETKVCTITNDDLPAHLTLLKTVIKDNGGTAVDTDWTLTGDGPTQISGVEGDATITDAKVDAGEYTLGEENGPSGYSAGDYSCVKNGAQPVSSNTLLLGLGDTATCTVTNDDIQPKLIVKKHVINDNGGTAVAGDFSMLVTGTNATPTIFGGVEAGTDVALDAGSYSAGETTNPAYSSSLSADCSGTIAVGETKTCTVTNDDKAPKLHLRKVVTNNNGGTASVDDFTLTANGAGANDLTGTSPVDSDATLQADTFALSETNVSGYSASDWVCVGGQQSDSNITVGIGQEATCTITNDDVAPKLHLRKVVTNNNGGTADASAWTLHADGTGANDLSGSTPVDSGSTLSADTFALSETGGPSGYDASNWVCVGGQQQGANITLGVGGEATCTITNDDLPAHLIVKKHVINDDGDVAAASDFTMHLTGSALSTNDFAGSEAGINVTLNAGAYTADETDHDGYTKTLSADCSGTIANGQTKTCTITNNDTPHPTRTQGFWQTHTSYTTTVFGTLGTLTIGTHVINSPARLFAGFYASISKTSTGAKRSQLDQARMQMLQQWLAAELNCKKFGCSVATQTLLTNAAAAWAGTNTGLIQSYASQLDAYNNSNDALPISGQGKATPKDSQGLAGNGSFWDVLP